MLRLFVFLAIGMKTWMLVDAYRRRAETYWLWIIISVPGGSLLYFFMVKMKDPGMKHLQGQVMSSLARPPDVQELREQYEESPSAVNRIRLAQGLGDAGRWGEAKAHFSAVLEQRPEDPDALFGLGVCELGLGNAGDAIAPLRRVTEVSPLYRDFAAYPELAESLYRMDRYDECLDLLRRLAKSQPHLANVVLLARYLKKCGKRGEASSVLRDALKQHARAPRYVKRNNRAAAHAAKELLSELA